jgi:acyl-CoA dehydrogenase
MISIEPIQRLANANIKSRALPDIVSGRKGSSLGITEPSGGSDVAGMKTTARFDSGTYVVNGSKTFITGSMTSDFFVIGARTGSDGLAGISLFFVDAATPGFSRTPLDRKMGWWYADQATLYFENMPVPAKNLMGEENLGFIAIMENFNLERVALIAGALGMMRVCLAESIDWAQTRQTFGKPLIRHKIADMSARIDAVEAYLN